MKSFVVPKPNFFPGQWIDYRDFNRLVQTSSESLEALNRAVYSGGGIISGVLSEFELKLEGDFQVSVGSGMAISPNGDLCILEAQSLLDLSPFIALDRDVDIRVYARNRVEGKDFLKDPEEPSVCGFRTNLGIGELKVCLDTEDPTGVEIFRVRINPSVIAIKPFLLDSWELSETGRINCHHQTKIQGYTEDFIHNPSRFIWRRSLVRLEQVLEKIRKSYLVEDYSQVGVFVSLLHCEILNRPFQLSKAQFLLEEVASRLCQFLDRWLREVSDKVPASDRDAIVTILQNLESLRVRRAHSQQFEMQKLIHAIDLLDTFVQACDSGIDFIGRIRTALIDWENTSVDFLQKMIFGGYSFQRVDTISPESTDRFLVRADHRQIRKVSAKYLNGDRVTVPGLMIKSGEIEAYPKVSMVDRPLVLLLRHYVRRPGQSIQIEWNGKHIHTESFTDSEMSNSFVNRFIVLPAEKLIHDENRLVLKPNAERQEFGFFGVIAYQPSLSGVK
jgi:hypothetical protein